MSAGLPVLVMSLWLAGCVVLYGLARAVLRALLSVGPVTLGELLEGVECDDLEDDCDFPSTLDEGW